MSQRERDALKVMGVVLEGRRTQVEAGRLLNRSVRQIRRIARRMEAEGDVGVVHRLRGRPSNRRLDEGLFREAVRIYSQEYGDFGPTMAGEKLAQRGIVVSTETLRRWLKKAGVWKGRRNRGKHRSRRATDGAVWTHAQMSPQPRQAPEPS